MCRMEVGNTEDFDNSLWNSMLHDDIYRIVFDFGLSCIRVEDKSFHVIYTGDMPKGYYNLIIRELANIVSRGEREAFIRRFYDKQLKRMPSDKQQEFIFDRNGITVRKLHVFVTINRTDRDTAVEFRFR